MFNMQLFKEIFLLFIIFVIIIKHYTINLSTYKLAFCIYIKFNNFKSGIY